MRWVAWLAVGLGACSNGGGTPADGGSDVVVSPDAPGGDAGGDVVQPSGEWPTYQHDPQRTGVGAGEQTLTAANVAGLKQHWKLTTGSTIEASASVANGTVYVGSWDGNEYAINAATGQVIWKHNLGTATVGTDCNPPYSSTMGVTASATVAGSVVYTAGGDNNFYALDTATGTPIWSVSTIPANDTQTDPTGFYTFSSPLIAGNYAYYGVGSGGNCPSVQGAMVEIDLGTHAIVSTFFDVPAGYLGGAVWGSPTINAAGDTIYYGTGNCNGSLADGSAACPTTSYTDALVALDVSTPGKLQFKGAYLLPSQPASSDWDFGSTPNVFDDGNGRLLVGSACKDGNFYALDASTMSLVWQAQLTTTNGGNPVAGDGSISPGAYYNGALYVAAGNGPGASFVYSLAPATGKANWTTPISAGVIMGPVVYANGLLYVGTGSQNGGASPTIQVLDANTGAVVTSVTTFASSSTMPNFISDSITVASGQLFFGLGNGELYAFGL